MFEPKNGKPRKSLPAAFPALGRNPSQPTQDIGTDSEGEDESPSGHRDKYVGLGLGRPIARTRWLSRRSSSGAFSSGSDTNSLTGTPTRAKGRDWHLPKTHRPIQFSPSNNALNLSPGRSASSSSSASTIGSPTGARYTRHHPFTPRPSSVRRLSDQSVERVGYFEREFEELDELGSGEFGKVIKVKSRTRHGEYAVKKSKRFEGVRHRLRLREEVEILQHLTCGGVQPNVLTFVDSWEEDDVLYIQTELCELGNLAHFLWEYGRVFPRLDQALIWKIMVELSNGLRFIHGSNVIHLDIKPSNIFVTGDRRLKIGDFGMASIWPRIVEAESVVGFEREGDKMYLAPEVLQGRYGKAADVFSFGMTMLETASNIVVPDQGDSWLRLRREDFSQIEMDDMPELFSLIRAMMRTEPDEPPTYPPNWHPMAPGVDPTDYRAFYPYTPNEVKHRKRTTSAQLKVLEGIFKRDTKPNAALRTELASQLNMTARGVQVWFQNRRAKEKNKAAKALKKDASSPSEDGEPCDSPSEAVPSLSSSLSPSPTQTSPPQLHVVTDSASSFGLGSPVIETPDDELPSLHSMRRGSLPVVGSLVDPLDPLARRRSVDASLARLPHNPYAAIARAKNSALLATQRLSAARQQPRSAAYMRPVMPHRTTVPIQHTRHSSMDARGYRIPQSPSPSPLSPFHAVSIRDHHLYPTRNISAPLPGPLPASGYSFGQANTTCSTDTSEHNSPVDFSNFAFPRPDTDTEDESSVYQVSRFGSIASESSATSGFYSDISNEAPDFRRRESCPTGFLSLMSGLDVNAPRRASVAEGLLAGSPAIVGYPSPASTVSPGSSPHLPGSSELNYALKHHEPTVPETAEPTTPFFYDANSYPTPSATADSSVEYSQYDYGMAGYVEEEFQTPTERYYEPQPVAETVFAYS
ncbi:hypothetical protein MIND_00068600 [Mycena indigotica]|uniref:Protein kinase domain-containing protein n=1 Tax=Mycena indigotica TaxID=2126181 RepID=A0A8H6TD72_9AGAR|nr:uncharacterized protein MIND_00068600 [Mycena indigotica]KAF7315533.1 hypothetical protein MIND_00068600 [Mycena indigotica]